MNGHYRIAEIAIPRCGKPSRDWRTFGSSGRDHEIRYALPTTRSNTLRDDYPTIPPLAMRGLTCGYSAALCEVTWIGVGVMTSESK
jgi:hypothetical protein